MIDNLSIFTKSGLVLWEEKGKSYGSDPIEKLVTEVFLEEKMHEEFHKTDDFVLYWTFHNSRDIVFVLVHKISMRTRLALEYSALVETVKKEFLRMFEDILDQKDLSPYLEEFKRFGKSFRRILRCWVKRKGRRSGEMRKYEKTSEKVHEEKVEEVCDKLLEEIEKEKEKERGKVDRFREEFGADRMDSVDTRIFPSNEEKPAKRSKKGGILSRMLESITSSSRQLGKEDLNSALRDFRDHLVRKNVAEDVSRKICQSLYKSLLGKRMGRISTVHRTVKKSMKESLTRILSPSQPIDIRTEILKNRELNRGPYTIVFCGMNGVGKSTSLSKIAFWLQSEGFSVTLCACDTYRSGAIEQLGIHANCLKSEFFQMGYAVPPYKVAKRCLMKKDKDHTDVVLIDTAGRMHQNQKLMSSLCKLVEYNHPNLVLFVGEALIGNLGVEQLKEFDDLLSSKAGHPIDGLILTKFDCIDDRVGTAVSLVYTSRKPILFIGNGQKYFHLKILTPEDVVHFLLKN